MADDHGINTAGQHGGNGTIGGKSAEVAADGGIHPVHALAAHLYGASLAPGVHGAEQVCFREVLYELHFGRVVPLQRVLGDVHNVAAPILGRGNAVDAAVAHGHIKTLQIQKNMFHRFSSQRRIA